MTLLDDDPGQEVTKNSVILNKATHEMSLVGIVELALYLMLVLLRVEPLRSMGITDLGALISVGLL